MSLFKSFVVLFSFVLATASMAAIPPESALTYKGSQFSYFTNHDLFQRNEAITQAILVVHGSDRNANTYFNTMDVLSTGLNVAASTMVISPHFKNETDTLIPNELAFTDEGWLRGDEAFNNPQISSFEIIDNFINDLLDTSKFPNLKSIIVTGHSAGGQLTQRYALGTKIESTAVAIHYIVVNPGSYAYLSDLRPVATSLPGAPFTAPRFEIPNSPACAYNDYKYGLDHLNAYLGQSQKYQIVNRYLLRDVTYLLGEADLITDELDNDCPAALQGKTRFERGQNFKAQLDQLFPFHKHSIVTVPGVGHTEWGIYSSETGKKVLFGLPSQLK